MLDESKLRVWIVSELYFPEETSTGHYMTALAEQLATKFDVHVLCNQPTYEARGIRASNRERRNGVNIVRCSGLALNKNQLIGKLANMITVTFMLWLQSFFEIKRRDVVFVVTNPPSLTFCIWFTCWLKRAKCVLICHDVYPDVLIHASTFWVGSWLIRAIGFANEMLLNRLDAIVAIGRDMRKLLHPRVKGGRVPIEVFTNWADLDTVHPIPREKTALLSDLGLCDKFVVQYCGNIGRTHNVGILLDAAEELVSSPGIHFLIIGSGAQMGNIRRQIANRQLNNITIRDRVDRSALNDALNSCDIAVISLNVGMAGVSVPSRMYNILAIGKPILAIMDEESEVARVVAEEGTGWVVKEDDLSVLVSAIKEASRRPDLLRVMGERGRVAACTKYTLPVVGAKFEVLIDELTHHAISAVLDA